MYTKIRHVFFCSFQSIKLNFKLKFWGYNEKNMGFHSTPKNVLLPVEGPHVCPDTGFRKESYVPSLLARSRVEWAIHFVVSLLTMLTNNQTNIQIYQLQQVREAVTASFSCTREGQKVLATIFFFSHECIYAKVAVSTSSMNLCLSCHVTWTVLHA